MRLKSLQLVDFGPFRKYSIRFDVPEQACLLLTGKNNEGKSHVLFALRLVDAALKVLGKRRYHTDIDGRPAYELLKKDVGNLTVGRLVYDYESRVGRVAADFKGGARLTVHLDPLRDQIYATSTSKPPTGVEDLFGFMPPLGQLADREERLTPTHLEKSIDSTLAPLHFRNHLYQTLDREERDLFRRIVGESWEGIEFLEVSWDWRAKQIDAFYREGRIDREVSWAGQGLQVWFQIVAHMVRLRSRQLLVLDEPEINLHAEKQHDLIRLLRDYHTGSVLIATHSVELMNDVGVSHIVHVQKKATAPVVKSTDDRAHLELIRSSVGSNFNLVASQFENVDLVLFTEDRSDYKIVRQLAKGLDYDHRLFSILLHGFSEYPKARHYRDAYRLLIGDDDTRFTALLDRDYYSPEYLEQVTSELEESGIHTVFTPGKEVENLFLARPLITHLLGPDDAAAWQQVWEESSSDQYVEALGNCITLYAAFPKRLDPKTATKPAKERLDSIWSGPERYKAVPGKSALSALRRFYRERTGANLSEAVLIDALLHSMGGEVRALLDDIFQAGRIGASGQ